MTKFKYFLSFCILLIITLFFIKPNIEKNRQQTVVFWTVQLAPFSNYINNVINDFEKQNPNIKIKWLDIPYSEAEKRILASLLSNNMPDLINITSDFNLTLATKGTLTPIEKTTTNFNQALLAPITYNEKLWGLPFYATSAITIFNKDLVEKFGIKNFPKTYNELFTLMAQSKTIPNKYIFMPTLTENDTTYKILNKYNINSPKTITTDEAITLLTKIKELYNQEKIPPEAITQTHREVLEKYSAEQLVLLQAGANFLNLIKENSLDVYSKTDVASQLQGSKNGYDFSLMTLAIPQKAKNKTAAFLFANFITNEKNQLEFAKLTGVLPCNSKTLQNDYFKTNKGNDLTTKARIISAQQLTTPINYPLQTKKHKEIIKLINQTTEKIILEDKNEFEELTKLKKNWSKMNEN